MAGLGILGQDLGSLRSFGVPMSGFRVPGQDLGSQGDLGFSCQDLGSRGFWGSCGRIWDPRAGFRVPGQDLGSGGGIWGAHAQRGVEVEAAVEELVVVVVPIAPAFHQAPHGGGEPHKTFWERGRPNLGWGDTPPPRQP